MGVAEVDDSFGVNVIEMDMVEVLEIVVGSEDKVAVELTAATANDDEEDVFVALRTDEIVDEVKADAAEVKIVVRVIDGDIVVDCEDRADVVGTAAVAVDEEKNDEDVVVPEADVVVV